MDTPLPNALAFDPVPTARRRRDGWTPERQRAFIAALAQLGLAGAAAREVGMSRKSAYALLKRAGPESGFARAWDEAVVRGRIKAARIGIERAIHGAQVPYFYGGLQRGTRTVYNDTLLITALRAVVHTCGLGPVRQPWDQEGLEFLDRFIGDSP